MIGRWFHKNLEVKWVTQISKKFQVSRTAVKTQCFRSCRFVGLLLPFSKFHPAFWDGSAFFEGEEEWCNQLIPFFPITMEVENGPKRRQASHLPFAPIFHGTPTSKSAWNIQHPKGVAATCFTCFINTPLLRCCQPERTRHFLRRRETTQNRLP